MSSKIIIEVNRLNFYVQLPNRNYIGVIDDMLIRLTTYTYEYNPKYKRKMRKVDKVYAYINHPKLIYGFAINTIKDFMLLLRNRCIDKDMLEVIYNKRDDKIAKLSLNMNPDYISKDYQQKYEDIITTTKQRTILIDILMGYGKTYIAMASSVKLDKKLCIFIKPQYIEKWIGDVKELTDGVDDDIYVVQGGNSLINLMEMVEDNNIPYKVFIFSINTVQQYIKDYYVYTTGECEEFTYPIEPIRLLNEIGVGTVISDESHQFFHMVYMFNIYFDADIFIGLSATLEHNDLSTVRVYNTLFPPTSRFTGLIEYKPYIHAYTYRYDILHPKRIRHIQAGSYNHNYFERNLLFNKDASSNYIKMIRGLIDEHYISRRTESDKCIVFVASIRLATVLANYYKKVYVELNVGRYVEDDAYSNIINNDLTFTTINSAGAALDIPNLITVIQTQSIESVQANKQSFGRLRNLVGKEMRYICIYSRSIPKQIEYYEARKTQLRPMTVNWIEKQYDHKI